MRALRRLRAHRRWAVVLLASVLFGLVGLAAVPHAAVADGLCSDAPPPVRPDFGTAGLTSGPRDLATVPEVAPNPFTDPSVPISDVYGYSYRWTNFDLGCGSDFVRDPVAVTTTTTANVILDQTTALLAAVGKLEELSRSSSITWISSVVGTIGDRLSPLVLTIWLPLSLMALGALFIWRSKRAGYSDTMTRVLILVAVVGISTFALLFPNVAAQKSDDFIKFVGSSAGSGFNDSATDTIARQSVYKTWLVGNFGSADSATAKEYGPRLMSALTYTWSDVKAIDADPDAKKGIDAAKAKEFTSIAKELEDSDPGAYESFTGRTDTRQGAALMGVLVFALMSFFAALSFVMMLLGRVIMQAMIIAVPVAGIIGVLKFDVLQRLWDLFTAAVIGVFKFTVAAGVVTLVLSGLQVNDDLGTGVKLLAMLVVTIAAIMITKPARTFKAMTPGLDPEKKYLSGTLARIGATAAGIKVGADLSEPNPQPAGSASRPTTDTGSRPVGPSMPALPPPPYATQQERERVTIVTTPAHQSDIPVRAELPAGTGPGPQRWAGLTAAPAGERLALTTGERATPRPTQSAPVAAPPALSAPRVLRPMGAELDQRADSEDTSRPARLLHRTEWDSRRSVVRQPELAPTDRTARLSEPDIGEVVYPTGVIVPRPTPRNRVETGLYRASGADLGSSGQQYIRMPEPILDQNGADGSTVVYHPRERVNA